MSIWDLEISKRLRKRCDHFGRAGISQRVLDLAEELTKNPSYFNAIRFAGRIQAIAQMARNNSYWNEKRYLGFMDELHFLETHKATVVRGVDDEVTSCTFEKEPD